ncbi:MAG: OB-fold nucleic acid binding domain-containing protein [Nanoarchaeota archaeon]|nr:OB-fold nucleic acid binding domain-containing protein [Nanoarchaeota archaeon]
MVSGNYEKIIEKMSKSSGVEIDEIERRIEAKRAKLSGLISKEGAAQVIAAELGINFDNEKLKIEELLPGMRKANVTGQIINLSPVRNFKNKAGKEGKVANLVIADDTSNVKVVLWDVHHIELIEKGKLKEGSVIEIINGSVRDGEVHLGSFSELKPSTEVFANLILNKVTKEKNVFDFKVGENVKVRAFVVQTFEPKVFEKKDGSGKGSLINIVIDDGSETIRTVLFNEAVSKIGLSDLDDKEKVLNQREDLLGKEMIFVGNVRNNSFFNTPEFVVDSVELLDLDNLISGLERR